MVAALVSAFVVGWLAFACALGLFLALAVRLKLRDRSEWPPALKRWHSIYSWPYYLLKSDTWATALDRRMVRLTRASGAISLAFFSIVAVAYLLLEGR